jgi:hypothetical protein
MIANDSQLQDARLLRQNFADAIHYQEKLEELAKRLGLQNRLREGFPPAARAMMRHRLTYFEAEIRQYETLQAQRHILAKKNGHDSSYSQAAGR